MKKGHQNTILILFSITFLISTFLFFDQSLKIDQEKITGLLTSGSTKSNVTIQSYFSIDTSNNLDQGVLFGTVETLPATDINATHNYDGTSNATTFNITLSTDSNVPVNFCIRANAALTDPVGGSTIGLGNETYTNGTINLSNLTYPPTTGARSLTIADTLAGEDVTIGADAYYRFWLDIPAGTEAGSYNNTVTFTAVQNTSSC